MGVRVRWRLWMARTVPAPALLAAFTGGVIVVVPVMLWLGVGRREVVRVVPGRPAAAQEGSADAKLVTPILRQSLREIDHWAAPASSGQPVEEFLSAQGHLGAQRYFASGCAADEVVRALDRQLAIQMTVARAHLALDPFGTGGFRLLSGRPGEALTCLGGALDQVPEDAVRERVEIVRLLARLALAAPVEAPLKDLMRREATRTVDGASDAAPGPVYALHAYLALESDLAVAGETVRHALRSQLDPAVQAALREVVSRRFSRIAASWEL
jgi:hypothetical protein